MSQFDQQLQAAKNKQRWLFISITAIFLVGLFIIIAVVLVSRGTRVEVLPDEIADQAILKINKGIAIIIGETLYSISKRPAVTAAAEGFRDKTQVLGNNDFGNVMSITLEPLPAKLELSTNVLDNKISWLINGANIMVANLFEHELDAGNYELTVSHPYYQKLLVPLSLDRGEVLNKTFELVAINGTMNINSIPSGARVSVNKEEAGVTPLNISISGGVHELALNHSGYESIVDTIEISRSNPSVKRDYHLELKKALVDIALKPKGGELLLNGISIKETDSLKVEAGVQHRLSYSRKGYFRETKTINLSADEKQHLSFDLKKEMGKVEIESTPDAEVIINEELVGTTPLSLSLNAVEQKITLSKRGYRSITRILTPSSSSDKKISVLLIAEEVARLKEAPHQYTNKAGGRLKLFKPNETFRMGADRSELGQRANEFLKNIKLSKAFFAGIYEVTNGEYKSFDAANKGNPKEPVTSITWIDAAAYCNWLSKLEGLTPVYNIKNNQLIGTKTDSDGYRLLTEAEWEWLARKAGKSKRTMFVWGDEQVIPKGAVNVADESAKGKVKIYVPKYNDGFSGIAPVGSFSVEKSGLYDMGGNVSEWTHESYSIVLPEANKVFQDPVASASGSLHVIKGANWRSGSVTELRPAYREGISDARDDLGFRIGRYVY
jgi:formylglycine-generating enzyme required for sulfatase activity